MHSESVLTSTAAVSLSCKATPSTGITWSGLRPGVILDKADEPTYLNGAAWCPIWPDHPDTENRDCGCDSSKYVGVPPLLIQDQTATLEPIRARDRGGHSPAA